MEIALVGAAGYLGSRGLAGTLRRGGAVTAIARDVAKLSYGAGLAGVKGELGAATNIVPLLARHDAVSIALRSASIGQRSVAEMVQLAAVAGFLVVGGAASREATPGLHRVDSPEVAAQRKAEALAARTFLRLLRGERALDWTFLSPSALLQPGERTGRFRLGCDQLLRDARGNRRITAEDLALAVTDSRQTPHRTLSPATFFSTRWAISCSIRVPGCPLSTLH